MRKFFESLLVSVRIPLATLSITALVAVIVESYINESFSTVKIFAIIILGLNALYAVLNQPAAIAPQTPNIETKNDGDSEQA